VVFNDLQVKNDTNQKWSKANVIVKNSGSVELIFSNTEKEEKENYNTGFKLDSLSGMEMTEKSDQSSECSLILSGYLNSVIISGSQENVSRLYSALQEKYPLDSAKSRNSKSTLSMLKSLLNVFL